MKSTHRRAASAAGFLALSLTGAPLVAQANRGAPAAQRGGVPKGDTPQILIATFAGTPQLLGVEVADEVRGRVQGEHSAQELFVVTKANINSALIASGYRPDSALNPSDLMELARITHGDYVLEGKVTKAGAGLHVTSNILRRTGTQTLTQPLPAVDGKDAGDVAKMIERNLTEALKQMPAYNTCIADLRAQKYDQAVKDGGLAVAAYQNSTFARICMLQAYDKLNATDDVIKTANEILQRDPSSMLALANLADAYGKKGDKDKVIEINLAIYRADPGNTQVATSIVNDLANSGAPDKALPIIDSLLAQNPADPNMLRTKWLLQLKVGRWKQAIATGEQLARVDTASVTLDFYNRQIGAAQNDSNTAKVQETAAKAAAKFTKDISLQLLLAQSYRKSGQAQQSLAAARKAMAIDPKSTTAALFAMYAQNDMNQPDSAMATARGAIASGASRDTIAQVLLANAAPAVKKAQDTKARADWEAALKASQGVDAIAPSPQSKFYIGVSAFQVGISMLEDLQALAKAAQAKKSEAPAACNSAKAVEDVFATAAVAMPAGAIVDKNVAGQILGAISQYTDFIGSVKKNFCK